MPKAHPQDSSGTATYCCAACEETFVFGDRSFANHEAEVTCEGFDPSECSVVCEECFDEITYKVKAHEVYWRTLN